MGDKYKEVYGEVPLSVSNFQSSKQERNDIIREKSITLKSNLVSVTSLLQKSKISSPRMIEQPNVVTGK